MFVRVEGSCTLGFGSGFFGSGFGDGFGTASPLDELEVMKT